jgi:hypothetical protein
MTDWGAYDAFLEETEREDRVGEHNAVVDSVEAGRWPSGDAYTKVIVLLITAHMARADMTLNTLLSPEEIEARSSGWDRGRKWVEGKNIRLYRELAEHYDIIDPMKIEKGDTFRVKTTKSKIDPMTGKGGFIRVSAILPKDGDIEAPANAPF